MCSAYTHAGWIAFQQQAVTEHNGLPLNLGLDPLYCIQLQRDPYSAIRANDLDDMSRYIYRYVYMWLWAHIHEANISGTTADAAAQPQQARAVIQHHTPHRPTRVCGHQDVGIQEVPHIGQRIAQPDHVQI